MAPRSCPHCRKRIDDDYYFDPELNMICSRCKKTIFPAVEIAKPEYSDYYYTPDDDDMD